MKEKEFMPKIENIRIRKRISRIKNYFTEKPKSNFWMKAFIYLFLFKYVGPLTIMFLAFFQVGLITPEADMGAAIDNVSIGLVEAFTTISTTLFDAGAKLANNNPIIAKILFYSLSNVVWIIWVGLAYVLLDLGRYFISWILRKKKK